MKKFLIIAGIFVLLFIVIVTVLFFSVKAYLTPEKVSALLSEKLESSLHHKVKLGPVTTGFSSAKVQGFSLLPNNPNDKAALVKVKNVSLSFSLIPLLKKRLNIQKIVIDSPSFYLVREKNGRLNWQEEFKKASFKLRGQQEGMTGWGLSLVSTAHAAQKARPKPKGFTIQVDKVEVRDGVIVWVDRSLTPVYKANLTSIKLDLEDFSLNKPFDFHLKGILKREEETSLEAKGKIDLARKDLKGELTLSSLFLPDLSPYLKGRKLKILEGTGKLELKISSRQFKIWKIEQKLVLQSVRIQAHGKTSQHVNASLNMEATLDLGKDLLSLKNVGGKVMDSDFKLNGDLEKLRTAPKGTLKFVSDRMDLDTLMGLFGVVWKASERGENRQVSTRGSRGGKTILPPQKPKRGKSASPTLPELTIQAKIHLLIARKVKIKEINAKIVTKAHRAILNLFFAKMYGGTIQGRVEVDLSSGMPVVRKKVSIKNVDVAPLLSELKPKMKEKFTGHFFGNAQGGGTFGAPSTYFGNVTFHVENGSIQNLRMLQMAAAIMKLPSLANLHFYTLSGSLHVENSVIQIKTTDAKGKDLAFHADGTIKFDKAVNLKTRLELPYRVVRKGLGKQSDLFADRMDRERRKWSIIPIKIKGTTDHPRVSIVFQREAVEKIIEKNIHNKKIKNLLKKLFR